MYGFQLEVPPGITADSIGSEIVHDLVLSPQSSTLAFGDLAIYRVGGAGKLSRLCTLALY